MRSEFSDELGPIEKSKDCVNFATFCRNLINFFSFGQIINLYFSTDLTTNNNNLKLFFDLILDLTNYFFDNGENDTLDKLFNNYESIYFLLDKVTKSNGRVMLTGPAGCGKEIAARYIHANSVRASEPFVSVSCASIS